jgi:hypothetical protein
MKLRAMPFGLSLSKSIPRGIAGFDMLSPNGACVFGKLDPNGICAFD